MINPASMMKLMSAKKQFETNHPKFVAFAEHFMGNTLEEGTILELTVTRPGQAPVTTNLKVLESDLELLKELKNLADK